MSDLYLFTSWKYGKAYFTDKKELPVTVKYNYSLFDEKMHILKNSKDTLEILTPYNIDSIIVNQTKFIYTYFKDKENLRNGYFEEIYCGKVRLLKRNRCILNFDDPTYKQGSIQKYRKSTSYYFQKENKIAVKVKLNRKFFLNYFSTHINEMKIYIQKNKILSEADLIRLLNYYNTRE